MERSGHLRRARRPLPARLPGGAEHGSSRETGRSPGVPREGRFVWSEPLAALPPGSPERSRPPLVASDHGGERPEAEPAPLVAGRGARHPARRSRAASREPLGFAGARALLGDARSRGWGRGSRLRVQVAPKAIGASINYDDRQGAWELEATTSDRRERARELPPPAPRGLSREAVSRADRSCSRVRIDRAHRSGRGGDGPRGSRRPDRRDPGRHAGAGRLMVLDEDDPLEMSARANALRPLHDPAADRPLRDGRRADANLGRSARASGGSRSSARIGQRRDPAAAALERDARPLGRGHRNGSPRRSPRTSRRFSRPSPS